MATTRGKWEVNVGDQVWIHSNGARRWEMALVEKIGPKLLHVRENQWRTTAFVLDTGNRRDGHPGGFQTLAQRADGDRRSELVKSLRELGIEFSIGSRNRWTSDAMEMVLNAAREASEKHPYTQ